MDHSSQNGDLNSSVLSAHLFGDTDDHDDSHYTGHHNTSAYDGPGPFDGVSAHALNSAERSWTAASAQTSGSNGLSSSTPITRLRLKRRLRNSATSAADSPTESVEPSPPVARKTSDFTLQGSHPSGLTLKRSPYAPPSDSTASVSQVVGVPVKRSPYAPAEDDPRRQQWHQPEKLIRRFSDTDAKDQESSPSRKQSLDGGMRLPAGATIHRSISDSVISEPDADDYDSGGLSLRPFDRLVRRRESTELWLYTSRHNAASGSDMPFVAEEQQLRKPSDQQTAAADGTDTTVEPSSDTHTHAFENGWPTSDASHGAEATATSAQASTRRRSPLSRIPRVSLPKVAPLVEHEANGEEADKVKSAEPAEGRTPLLDDSGASADEDVRRESDASILSDESGARRWSTVVKRMMVSLSEPVTNTEPMASFVSRILHKSLTEIAHSEEDPTATRRPYASIFSGAAIFADASGFTALTEKLADVAKSKDRSSQGDSAELLSEIINSFFSRMIDIVALYGGDAVKFSGDAVCIIWPCNEDEAARTLGFISRDMQTAVRRAAACASHLHEELDNFVVNVTAMRPEGKEGSQAPTPRYSRRGSDMATSDRDEKLFLNLHIGLGCGEFTAIHVGGVFNRMEFVLSGPPMRQVGNAEPLALPGETVVSPEALEYLYDAIEGTTVAQLMSQGKIDAADGEGCEAYVRLDNFLLDREELQWGVRDPPRLPVTETVGQLMKRYIPHAAIRQVTRGMDGYLHNILPVSVIFVSVDGVRIEKAEDGDIEEAKTTGQKLMLELQRCVYEQEGAVNKLLVDDKGLLVLCALGLPPFHHSDDPLRAVTAALTLVDNLKKLSPNAAANVGVATGYAFCGVVGSASRREYTMMGKVVNLAARLMGKASQHFKKDSSASSDQAATGGVVIDDATHAAIKDNPGFKFTDLLPFKLKGIRGLVSAYIPVLTADPSSQQQGQAPPDLGEDLAGRERELDRVTNMVKRLKEARGGPLVVTGDRGSGKTQIVSHLADQGHKVGLTVLYARKKSGNHGSRGSVPAPLRKELQSFDLIQDEPQVFEAWHPVLRLMLREATADGDKKAEAAWIHNAARDLSDEHRANLWMLRWVLPDLSHYLPAPPEVPSPHEGISSGGPAVPRDSVTPTLNNIFSVFRSKSSQDIAWNAIAEEDTEQSDDGSAHSLKAPQPLSAGSYTSAQRERATDSDSNEHGSSSPSRRHDSNSSSGPEQRGRVPPPPPTTLGDLLLGVQASERSLVEELPQELVKLCGLLLELILEFARTRPTMIILHLQTGTALKCAVDPESWLLAAKLSATCVERQGQRLPPLILGVATRSLGTILNPEIKSIWSVAQEHSSQLELRPLDDAKQSQYTAEILTRESNIKVREPALPPQLMELLHDMAAGNPKHIKELCHALMGPDARGRGKGPAIRVLKNGRVEVLCDLSEVEVPNKMEGLVRQEFDQLRPEHQLWLKRMCLFPAATPWMIWDVHRADGQSLDITPDQIGKDLEELCNLAILTHTQEKIHPSVWRYFPQDIGRSPCYIFVSKLMKRTIEDMVKKTRERFDKMNSVKRGRLQTVSKSLVRLQAFCRGVMARKEARRRRVSRSLPSRSESGALTRRRLAGALRMSRSSSFTKAGPPLRLERKSLSMDVQGSEPDNSLASAVRLVRSRAVEESPERPAPQASAPQAQSTRSAVAVTASSTSVEDLTRARTRAQGESEAVDEKVATNIHSRQSLDQSLDELLASLPASPPRSPQRQHVNGSPSRGATDYLPVVISPSFMAGDVLEWRVVRRNVGRKLPKLEELGSLDSHSEC